MNKRTESLTNTKKASFIHTTPSTQPFNAQVIYQETLKDLIRLAKKRGWKEWTWHEVLRLNADTSGLFTGIKDDFLKAVKNAEASKT